MGAQFTKNNRFIANDLALSFGSDRDNVLVHRSASLAANTALTGVLEGTPVTPLIAADSLILSNTTASGDIVVAFNIGGTSKAAIWIDGSGQVLNLFKTSAVAGWKVDIGDDDGTNATYGAVLRVTGTSGRVLTVRRLIGGVEHSVTTQFGSTDSFHVYRINDDATLFHVGADNTADTFEIGTGDSLGAGNKIMSANASGDLSFFGATPQAQQVHIVDATGTLADITTKFNTLLADLEGYGLLAAS